MKKFNKYSIILALLLLSTAFSSKAQVTGSKSVPGDYATLADAIADLNAVGVGAGGATINVNAAQSAPAGGYVLGSATLNASTSAANPLVINGGNNTITAQVGTGTGASAAVPDAVFIVSGADYVTLNQLSIVENSANTTHTTQMEAGILVRSRNTDDASKFLTIQGCNVNLNGTANITTTLGIFETGISVQAVPVSTAISPVSITATAPTSTGGVPSDIVIKANTVQNCYNGIVVIGNSTVANFSPNVVVGGNSAADGNTITGVGSKAPEGSATVTTNASAIWVLNTFMSNITHNVVTANNMFSGFFGIQTGAEADTRIVRHNTVSGSNVGTGAQAFNAIYNQQGSSINAYIDSNTIQNVNLTSIGAFYGVFNVLSAITGTQTTNNNTINNITRPQANVTGAVITYGIFSSATSNVGMREIRGNIVSNITHTSANTATPTIHGIFITSTQPFVAKGNQVSSILINGTGTGASVIYGINNQGTLNTHVIDSNRISGLSMMSTSAASGTINGILSNNGTGNYTINQNNINTLTIASTAGVVSGILLSGNAASRLVSNNFVSGLTAPSANVDNAVRGIDATGGLNNQLYHNTIALGVGSALGSTGTNFGASGICWVAASTDLRNNISYVNATPNGNGYVSAIRVFAAGTNGTVPVSYMSTSNNNILFAPNAAKSFLYCEAATGAATAFNSYNLTNDPAFNTGCGLFKTFVAPRDNGTFTENNLSAGSLPNTFVPTGNTFAESSAQFIATAAVDYGGVTRGSGPDMGALEINGLAVDATAPAISYTALPNTLCLDNPIITATITDVSGINSVAGTLPRVWFKKSTENNVLPATNTSADNGWKWVEASNTASPYTISIDYSLLNTPIAAGDVIQYFVVAQDLAPSPNIGKVTATFAAGFCPISVALSSAAFPVTAPGQYTINPIPPSLTATSFPTDFCVSGSPALSTTDNAAISGVQYQWQSSPAGANTFTDIPGGTVINFNAPTITVNTDYRLNIFCGSTLVGTSAIVNVPVSNPLVNTTTPATICGPNTTSVSATTDPGQSIRWYNAPTGGNLLHIGNTYNTPLLLATTTYYALATSGATVSGGRLNNTGTGSAVGTTQRGVVFTTTQALTIDSIGFRCTGNPTTLTLALYNAAGTTQIGSNITVSIPSNSGTTTTPVLVTVPATISIPAAGTYRIFVTGLSPAGAHLYGETASVSGFPYAVGPNMSITGTVTSLTGAAVTNQYYYFYKFSLGRVCEGVRVPVEVTYTNPPAITMTSSQDTICFNGTTSSTLTLSSPNDPNYTYVWSPSTGLSTTTGANIIATPLATTTYTMNATDASTGCASIMTKIIGVRPTFSINTSVTPTLVCPADSVTMSVTVTPSSFVPSTYSWAPSAGFANPNAGNTKVNSLVTNTYTLTASDSYGCTATSTRSFTVYPLATGTPSVTATNFCQGGSTTINSTINGTCFQATSGFQNNYNPINWNQTDTNSNGFVYTGLAPNSIAITSGDNQSLIEGVTSYNVPMTCSGTVTFNWTFTSQDLAFSDRPRYKINGGPEVLFNGFNIFGGVPQSGTQTITVNSGDILSLQMWTFENYGTPGTVTISNFSAPAPQLYGTISVWDAPTGGTNLGTPPYTFTPQAGVTYYTQYTQDVTGCINPIRTAVPLNVYPLPNVTAAASPNDTVCFGEPVTLMSSNATNYTWNGNATVGSDTVLTPAVAGIYTVQGTDANGCTNSASIIIAVNTLPVVTAQASVNPVCAGSNTILTGSGASTYSWTNSVTDGTAFAPTNTDTYVVTGTDANGCTNTSNITVNVNALPIVVATASPNDSVCIGNPVTLMGSGANTYTWNGVATVTSDSTLTPATAGIYTVQGTDGNGCTNTATIEITVNALPTVTATATDNEVCDGEQTTLTGGGASTYSWTGGVQDGVAFAPTATNTYQVTGTDANGCSNTSATNIIVNPLPTITATPPTQVICGSTPVTVAGGGAGTGGSYVWTGGIFDNTPFTPTSTTTYQVTGTDANGCSNTATAQVVVDNLPSLTVTATPSNSACFQNAITLTGSGAATYIVNGNQLSGTDTTFIAFVPNTYNITGVSAGGCTASTSISISVSALSGSLAQTSGSNSVAGASNTAQVHPDGSSLNYTDASCNLIAIITDGFGGSTLGSTTATVTVDASVQLVGSQPYVPRWYIITPTNTAASAQVKLFLTQNDFDVYNTYAAANGWPLLPTSGNNADPNIGNARVTKTSALGTVVLTPSLFWNGLYWEATIAISSFSEFRFHTVNPGNSALPVVISAFDGKQDGSKDVITWKTSSEQNNAYFNLYHSKNGSDFKNIAKVNSKATNGNSAQVLDYAVTYETPSLGHNYYKLEQVDIDGNTATHAKVIDLVRTADGSTISVYPNPTRDILHVEMYTPKQQTATIKILDMSGRIVKQLVADNEAGTNTISISLSDLVAGVYTIQVYDNGRFLTSSKVQKQ